MRAELVGHGGRIVLLGTVQGLLAEAAPVRSAILQERPAAVALGTSPEGAAALLQHEGDLVPEMLDDLPDHDLVYGETLRQYGDVGLPPPDLLTAARTSRDVEASLYGIDLAEEIYAERFTRLVSVWDFLKLGRVQKRLAKRPPQAPDARAFCLAWDARMREVKGLARVERLREETMAANARSLVERDASTVVLVIELPRAHGVRDLLIGHGFAPRP